MAREQGGNTTALYSAHNYKSFTSLAADIDLQDTSSGIGANCRQIRCESAGILQVLRNDGTQVALQFTAGEKHLVVAQKIVASGSTVTCDATHLITVYG